MGRDGEDGEGRSGRERVWKREGGLDLDICPGDPELLVTPLHMLDRSVVSADE